MATKLKSFPQMRASLSYCLTSVQGEAEVLHHKGCVTVVKVYKQLPDNDKSAGLSARIFSSILPNNQHTFIIMTVLVSG